MSKVSIVVPIYNVEQYLRECLNSLISQTLEDIEIICVNDGSTDGCPDILKEYEQKDKRIKVINKPNSGYGHTMNVGMDYATGEYFGIVESDDYVVSDMYETLYEVAKKSRVDFVKADYCRFTCVGNENVLEFNHLCKQDSLYGRILNPKLRNLFWDVSLYTWSGIYSMDFLRNNNIRHNETPGASYQDNGFWFQTFAFAEKVMFHKKSCYRLRRDNPNSSFHSKAKVYCVFEEYDFIRNKINQSQKDWERLKPIYWLQKFRAILWHYDRVGLEYKLEFLERCSKDFAKDDAANLLDLSLFSKKQTKKIKDIINDPVLFYFLDCYDRNIEPQLNNYNDEKQNQALEISLKIAKKEIQSLKKRLKQIQESKAYRLSTKLSSIPKRIRSGVQCVKDHGFSYTFRLVNQKIFK